MRSQRLSRARVGLLKEFNDDVAERVALKCDFEDATQNSGSGLGDGSLNEIHCGRKQLTSGFAQSFAAIAVVAWLAVFLAAYIAQGEFQFDVSANFVHLFALPRNGKVS